MRMHAILIKTNNDEADRKNQFQTNQVHATCDCLSSTACASYFIFDLFDTKVAEKKDANMQTTEYLNQTFHKPISREVTVLEASMRTC